MRRALIPGTFDPPTSGHLDMIRRTAILFDEVYVIIFDNSEKRKMFEAGVRLELVTLACASLTGQDGMGRIIPGLCAGMLSDYAEEHKIDAVVKGARNATDFDYEYWLSIINRSFNPAFETLIMPAKAEFQHISSTVVRELIKYGKPLKGYVPDAILNALQNKYYTEVN